MGKVRNKTTHELLVIITEHKPYPYLADAFAELAIRIDRGQMAMDIFDEQKKKAPPKVKVRKLKK